MRVKVDNDVFDVEVQSNGDWKFSWTDWSGFNYHTYSKTQVHKFLIERESWTIIPDLKVEIEQEVTLNYAAAFNMWLSEYMNDPQSFQDSQQLAITHLKEKMSGAELSYGEVAAEQFKGYLEKVK